MLDGQKKKGSLEERKAEMANVIVCQTVPADQEQSLWMGGGFLFSRAGDKDAFCRDETKAAVFSSLASSEIRLNVYGHQIR